MNDRFRFGSIYLEIFEFDAPYWRKGWHRILHATKYKRREFVKRRRLYEKLYKN